MKVFIAGPRAISSLNVKVKDRLNNIMNNEFTVIVGDANGIDKAIQKYFNEVNYNNIMIYATNGKARNNIGDWKVVKVDVPPNTKGFNYYAAKDIEMAKNANYGFMIWNGKSKGTLNNIINLIKFGKSVLVYFIPAKNFYEIKNFKDIKQLTNKCDTSINQLINELLNSSTQLTLNI
ncbi:MAG: hypothetical protein LKF87_12230 [Clostridium tyrobutyricum]|jgi:hypothetical protein|uniref:hypothetical protein n=1 Tax=Clostridium tyrobutyricum TaxID=1519 RepID=UPI00242E1AE7|nr:hypothetical protein [Clostridium tyrobutyricum]MCH4200556.1 hypothetical protein [Clostridium tyrobutyricum]MCH4237596.1 hypothetical protein [Clostridium tyrobutyricum]MCH4259693.1 hypothetical protein [Clostridium tyrobutyricum]